MTVGGGMAGVLLTGVLSELFLPFPRLPWTLGYGWLTVPLFTVVVGGLLWLPVGVAQGLVLRRVIPHFDRRALGRGVWTMMLAGGGAMALSALLFGLYLLLALTVGDSLTYSGPGTPSVIGGCIGLSYLVMTGLGIGAVFGFSQSALLGRYVFVPDVWSKATLLGWGVVMPLGLLLLAWGLSAVPLVTAPALMGMMPGLQLSNILLFALVITLPAIVTGLALPRLMTLPAPAPPPNPPVAPPPWRRFALPRLRPVHPDLPRRFPE
jgi:hypothetical protein